MMELFFSILSLAYLGFLTALFISWKKIGLYKADGSPPLTFISVIVPVRNEEKNILNLLNDFKAQTYPASLFEVIIVDDHSSDATAEIVRSYASAARYTLSLYATEDTEKLSFKKQAIETGIGHARGSLIVTTDGDCRAGADWLGTIESFYRRKNAKFISSPVGYSDGKDIFSRMQAIEFASLIGTGAASLHMGLPNMCNGANIAYEKQAFLEADGFKGNEDIPSGDDEFLMHKIYRRYPDKVLFLKSTAAMVWTGAKESLSEFSGQRRRWASKWGKYTFVNIKVLAVLIFLYNLAFLFSLGLTLAGIYPIELFLCQIIPKIIIEVLFISSVMNFSGRRLNPLIFFFLQIIYPFYIVLIAILSRIGGYSWKGRKISS